MNRRSPPAWRECYHARDVRLRLALLFSHPSSGGPMRCLFFSPVALLAGITTVAAAQNPPVPPPAPAPAAAAAPQAGVKLADYAGTWDTKTMVGPKDSVVATYTMTVSADGKTWTRQFPNRDPIATRVLAFGGDSVVTEAGPYQSGHRPGHQGTAGGHGPFHRRARSGTGES